MTVSHVSVGARRGTPHSKRTSAGSADGPAFEAWTVRGSRARVFVASAAVVVLAPVSGFAAVVLSAVVLHYRVADAPPSDEPAVGSAGLLAAPDLAAGLPSVDPSGFVEPVWSLRDSQELGDRYDAGHLGEPHLRSDHCCWCFGLVDANPDCAAGWSGAGLERCLADYCCCFDLVDARPDSAAGWRGAGLGHYWADYSAAAERLAGCRAGRRGYDLQEDYRGLLRLSPAPGF